MKRTSSEMLPEEIEAIYGEAHPVSAISYVLSSIENSYHDRFTFEVITQDSRRLTIPFTQSALQSLMRLVGDKLSVERPKAH